MAATHEIAQGEYLSMIASQYGFPDYTVIWNDGQNARLKQQRKNPNVLLPGDSLYIPDKLQGNESGATSKRHTFQLNIDELMLKLVLEDIYEKPVANTPITLSVDQDKIQLTTDGKGKLEHQIAPTLQQCALSISTDETPFQDQSLLIYVGHLDPLDTPTGQFARLLNLGYAPGNLPDATTPEFLSAVEEFQCDNKLSVDGDLGPATQAKLQQIHGC